MLRTIRKIAILVAGSLSYIAVYILLRFIFNKLPDLRPWEGIDLTIVILQNKVALFDIIYFLLGLVFFTHGTLRLVEISRQNNGARDSQTRLPVRLLTDGYYGKVRHPMYGSFMLIQAGTLFSLRSLIGLGIAVLVIFIQSINGIVEEKNQLVKIFSEEYELYRKKVKAKYLTGVMKVYFVLAGLLSVAGVLFM